VEEEEELETLMPVKMVDLVAEVLLASKALLELEIEVMELINPRQQLSHRKAIMVDSVHQEHHPDHHQLLHMLDLVVEVLVVLEVIHLLVELVDLV
jgi:hypothetical protein